MATRKLRAKLLGRQHADATVDPIALRAALDPRQETGHGGIAAVRAEQHCQPPVEPKGDCLLERDERQIGATGRQWRAEIGDAERPARWGRREQRCRVDLRPEQSTGRQTEDRVSLACGLAQIDQLVGPGTPQAGAQQRTGQDRVEQRQRQQLPFAHKPGHAQPQQLPQPQAWAGHDQGHRCTQVEPAQPGELRGASQHEHPIDRHAGQGGAQLGAGLAAGKQGAQRLHGVGRGRHRPGQIGEQPHVVAQGAQPSRDPVGHVPGLPPAPLGREAAAHDREPPRGLWCRLQLDHAARSCRSP